MESRRAYNLYLPTRLHAELQRLIDAGLPASAVARLAVRKWSGGDLPAGDDAACPIRVNVYLSSPDAERLELLATGGGLSRAETLRRLITIYIDTNRKAIRTLF